MKRQSASDKSFVRWYKHSRMPAPFSFVEFALVCFKAGYRAGSRKPNVRE